MNVQTLKEMMIKYKGLLDELEELYRQLNDSGYLTPEFEEKMIQVQGEQDRILTELLPAFQAQYPALIKGLWEVDQSHSAFDAYIHDLLLLPDGQIMVAGSQEGIKVLSPPS